MTAAAQHTRTRARRGEGERLREEILAATERLLLQTGDVEAVSIRMVCEEVGVTPPSIYLHFADKDALVLAVCERHFAAFDAQVDAAAAGVHDPLEALCRRGQAYVRFGLENPEPYRILFMSRHAGTAGGRGAPSAPPGADTFGHLVDAVRRCIDARAFRPVDPFLAATVIWTALHGVTSLLISLPRFPWPERETLVAEVCAAQVRAFTAEPPPSRPRLPRPRPKDSR